MFRIQYSYRADNDMALYYLFYTKQAGKGKGNQQESHLQLGEERGVRVKEHDRGRRQT